MNYPSPAAAVKDKRGVRVQRGGCVKTIQGRANVQTVTISEVYSCFVVICPPFSYPAANTIKT